MDNESKNKHRITREKFKKLFSEHKKLWIILAAAVVALAVTGTLLGVLLPRKHTVYQLSAPIGFTVNSRGEAVWNKVDNAVGYELVVGDIVYSLEDNQMLLSEGLAVGNNFLKVKALGDNINYQDSEYSLYTYAALSTPFYHFVFELNAEENGYKITSTDNLPARVIIPETYNDLPITAIAKNAFFENDAIESVVIGKSVNFIDEGAFTFCKNLMAISVDPENSSFAGVNGILYNKTATTLYAYPMGKDDVAVYQIPSSLNMIYYGALGGVSLRGFSVPTQNNAFIAIDDVLYSLENGIPNSLVAYPKDRLANNLAMSEDVLKIESYAFYNAGISELSTYATYIGDYAFYTSSLTSFTSNGNISHIGISAFSKSSLANLDLEFNEGLISTSAFYQCINLRTVVFRGSITNMYSKLFYECTLLSNVEFDLSADLDRIYTEIFENCYSLKSFTIKGTTAPELGSAAFLNTSTDLKIYCENSKLIDYRSKTAWKSYAESIFPIGAEFTVLGDYDIYTLGTGLTKELGIIKYNGEQINLDLTFADYILTSIMGNAFSGKSLESLNVPDGIRYIGMDAFSGNDDLSVIIFNSTEPFYLTIGALDNLSTSLKIYVAGYHYAFRQSSENNNGFSAYSSIIYPIGTVFASNLTYDYYIYELEGEKLASIKKYNATAQTSLNVDYIYHNTVPYKVVGIDEGAFATSSLESIELSDKVQQLEQQAFYNASALVNLTLHSIEPISALKNSLPNNTGIKIFVPSESVSLYKQAETFSGFSAKIYPIGTTFESNADYDYSLFEEEATIIKYKGSASSVDISLIGSYPVVAIADEAFYAKQSIVNVTVGDSVKYIGEKAFNSALNLTSVTCGNGLLEIGDMAFSNIYSEISISFGSALTKINGSPFFNTKLIEISIASLSVPEVDETLFSNLLSSETKIFVPNESLYDYKSADVFKNNVLQIYPIGAQFLENTDWKFYVLNAKATLLKYIGDSTVTTLTVSSVDGYEVETLGENLFSSNRVTILILGAGVKTIRASALINLTRLTELVIQYNETSSVIELLNANAISKNALTKITVKPILVETYKNSVNWSEFKDYIGS